MTQVLIVEDSTETQEILKKILSGLGAGFQVAGNLSEARTIMAAYCPSLILLDIQLPDGDGFQFCGELAGNEQTKKIPFLFISGKGDVQSKVAAFSFGAEDYIVKPFNAMELKARLEAKLKKISATEEDQAILKRGLLWVDSSRQRVFISCNGGRKAVQLTTKEFLLLVHLARHEEQVLSRNQLMDAVWGSDAAVFDRTVDAHISAIRKKLGPVASYIESVPGMGYRFSSSAQLEKAAS